MKQLQFKIEEFEGPLDLLLVLISKNKMKIFEIEIITIINQYLEVIKEYQNQDLDIASDFIDMAARLIYIKSVYLLPKNDEGEKLKQELQGRLIEYSQAKQAAAFLKESFIGDNLFLIKAQEVEVDLTYDIQHPVNDLLSAYMQLSDKSLRRRPPQQEKFEPLVSAPVVSVQSKIYSVLKNLMRSNIVNIKNIFNVVKSKSEAVATFLAILELIRAQRVAVNDDGQMSIKENTRR